MPPTTSGLHHVTAIAGDPERNADVCVSTEHGPTAAVRVDVDGDETETDVLERRRHRATGTGTRPTAGPGGADSDRGRMDVTTVRHVEPEGR